MFSLWYGERREYEYLLEEASTRESALEQEVSSLSEELSLAGEEIVHKESQLLLSRERSRQLEGYIEERADNPEIKIAYITIDDGPSSLTGELLDVLGKKSVPAAFFVVGPEEPELEQYYSMIAHAGYPFGNHSYHHDYPTLYSGADEPRSVDYMVNRMKEQIFYRKNVTILLHDHETNVTTPEALGLIIDHLWEEGYCILPLSENSRPVRF